MIEAEQKIKSEQALKTDFKRATVDIFCRVVDHYGDAGVCWRLARQLAFEHGLKVRLIIDDLEVLSSLVPRLASARQRRKAGLNKIAKRASPPPVLGYLIDGVRVFEWKTRAQQLVGPARLLKPAELVIAAFACHLPHSYLQSMLNKARFKKTLPRQAPRWLNLEYLSAESWVQEHHRLASLKPNGLVEHFFFPGFVLATGGLLRERDLLNKRDAFCRDLQAQQKLAHELGISDIFEQPREQSLLIFVFCYPAAPLDQLVQASATWLKSVQARRAGISSIQFLIPEGMPLRTVPAFSNSSAAGTQVGAGTGKAGSQVKFRRIPRLAQERFDEILWLCDANFVRGEDSLVRAIWAGKPMLWHIYPQANSAHQAKLEAFLAMVPNPVVTDIHLAWNDLTPQAGHLLKPPADLPVKRQSSDQQELVDKTARWLNDFKSLRQEASNFATKLARQTDLATQILNFSGLKTTPRAAIDIESSPITHY